MKNLIVNPKTESELNLLVELLDRMEITYSLESKDELDFNPTHLNIPKGFFETSPKSKKSLFGGSMHSMAVLFDNHKGN